MLQEMSLYYLCFLVYSFVGWAFEVMLYIIRDRKFVNRGFLNGPYCPIYGVGALLILLLFGRITNLLSLFLSSAVICCTLEYVASYVMEKLFHARWWDYSELPFNLNGRVCLLGAVTFGTFAVLLTQFIHPFVAGLIGRLPVLVLYIAAGALFLLFTGDCLWTFSGMIGFHERIEAIAEHFEEKVDEAREKFRELPSREVLRQRRERILKHLNLQHRRVIRAFPRMKLLQHNELLGEIREALRRHKEK